MRLGRRARIGFSVLLAFLLTGSSVSLLPRGSLAQAQSAPSTTINPITFSVSGATFIGSNMSGQDTSHYYTFSYVMDSGSTLSVQASSAGNPLCCNASYSGISAYLSVQMIASDGENSTQNASVNATTASPTVTSMGPLTASLQPTGSGVTSIRTTIEFDADCGSLRGCPAPWEVTDCYNPCPLDISVDVTIKPTLSVTSSADVVSAPGSVTLSGTVAPALSGLDLRALRNGVLNYSDTIYPTAQGAFTYNATMSDSSFAGTWNFTVIASNNGFNATASVIVQVTAGGGTPTTTSTTIETTTSSTKPLPIILIPGIGGSELQSSASGGGCGYIGCHEVWPLVPTPGYHFSDLALNDDGTPLANVYIYPTNILDLGVKDLNFYGGLESFLTGKGYVLGQSLFLFPYDWRLDNGAHLDQLDALINQARVTNGSQQVVIIAHSMGGLIATGYVNSSPSRAAKVASIITVGTPFFGSPKVFYGLTEGYAFDNIFANLKDFKTMMQNWAGGYELLPKTPFIHTANGFLSLGTTYDITYKSSYGYAWWYLNSAMLDAMTAFNSLIGTPDSPRFPGSMKLYTIIGYGTQTLTGYTIAAPTIKEMASHSYVTLNDVNVTLIPIFGDGDGTVPLWGANNTAASAKYFIGPDDGGGAASHGRLPGNTLSQDIIWSIVTGSPMDPSKFVHPSSATLHIDDKTDVTIHSNANLEIVDQSGNVLGWNGGNGTVSEDIPGGTFIDQNGVQYASISGANTPYTLFVNGTSAGTFQLTINVTSGGRTTSITYPEVPVQVGTASRLSFDPITVASSSYPSLSVTTGGNTTTYAYSSVSQTTISGQTTSGSGGIPEFPAEYVSVALFTTALVLSYFFARGRAPRGAAQAGRFKRAIPPEP